MAANETHFAAYVESTKPSELALALSDVVGFVRSFVVLDEVQADAIALWTAHTHAFDGAAATPYLAVTSATKESGKTRLCEALELLVARPWYTSRTTAAALARKVDKFVPTLLLDESDAAFNGDREYAEVLRGLLNSGHRRGGAISVCVGQGAALDVRDFSTFCPKLIAGIGSLPDTVQGRSIPIRLKRKAPGESVERFRRRQAADLAEPIHQSLAGLGEYHAAGLEDARPELPAELPDRAADGWEPLIAIADLAGGDWPLRARAAAVELSGRGVADDGVIGVQLLGDCQRVFGERDRLPTKDLIAELCRDEEAPWATWHKGSPITARALARLLVPFGIRSRSIRTDDGTTPKGYVRESFEDAWERYLAPVSEDLSATPPQPASLSQKPADSIRNTTPPVALLEKAANPHGKRDVAGVADRKPLLGDEFYPLLLAESVRDGHITHVEARKCLTVHELVERDQGAA